MDENTPTYFTLYPDLSKFIVVNSTFTTISYMTYTGVPGTLTNNTGYTIKNQGSLTTDTTIEHFEILYLEDLSFTLECTCVSALYVDIAYTFISSSAYLSMVSSNSSSKEINVDYSLVDF